MTASTELPDAPASTHDPEFEQALAHVLCAAIEHHQKNEVEEAQALYRIVLDASPAHADAHHNLGALALQQHDFERAIPHFEAAVGANPDQGHYWASYINALTVSGQTSAAWVALEMAQQRGMKGPAVDRLIQQLVLSGNAPTPAPAALAAPAPVETAVSAPEKKEASAMRMAVPPQQQINRVTTLYHQGRTAEALEIARQMTERFPNFALGWRAMGSSLHSLGRTFEAIEPFARTVELEPTDVESRKVLADCLRLHNRFADAEAACREVLAQAPEHAEAYRILGMTLQSMGRHEEAEACCRKTVELTRSVVAYSTLGVMLLDQGRLKEAQIELRRALEIKPDYGIAHENILFCMSHDEDVDANALFAQHVAFGEQCEAPLRAQWKPHANSRHPERKLKVGFVSGDLFHHAISTFIEPIFEHLAHDAGLEIHVYYSHSINDDVTARLRQNAARWNPVNGLTDVQLADKIRADGIDVLIDLSGHTSRNRLLMFARKPAPIQASWMGYPGTTGLTAMDYYLADSFHVPEHHAQGQFVEKIAYLPANAPFQPARYAPPVNGLPALHNGYLTFGSFNRINKIQPRAIALWAELLRALPDSRMLLGAMPPDSGHETLTEWFAREGIARERLDFRTRSNMPVYLQQHHHVDLCLDTFPYSGGTTTLHAMWMGVPTITLPGRLMASRGSTAALSLAGLGDFVAKDNADFVAKGLAWANDLTGLAQLRASMRERCAESPMLQPAVIAAGLSASLREMWRRWCAGLAPAALEAQQPGETARNSQEKS
ncbi:tetratricopeptide repeat protein [Caballeronia sp. LZ062]|uniref:tetratricopeptide repeat protein n=1 Tax=unclassified Caballeronia TaxID=2646786 RepID=UPI00285C78C4|nr:MULTISPECIES: tetratricopeptide repeat protein [unclassified Caballeronia]MDR5853375.1 tetratricopeptide repeat protein [Caballeronia sp. LZ050]MDR5872090.1 tetratricopeptide repeat protein [Caballeronia sp. LZ062]